MLTHETNNRVYPELPPKHFGFAKYLPKIEGKGAKLENTHRAKIILSDYAKNIFVPKLGCQWRFLKHPCGKA